ncbi:MAG: toxin-antitoxin system YwqK family antitoxin [Marinilabiliaceae bacterium]|nr:toxin-antitoxin system YwqK family antitoxin [Marinilabiliaceae bacterium]
MKKFLTIFGIVIASIALLVGGYILFHKLFVNKGNSDAFSYVPSDAVFVVETDNLSKAWLTISQSELWQYLQTTPYFADVNEDIELLNKFIKSNSIADKLLSDRKLLVVGCMEQNSWDLLYLIDLQEFASYYDEFKGALRLVSGFTLTTSTMELGASYGNIELYTLTSTTDPKMRYSLVLKDNILMVSSTDDVIASTIKKINTGHWADNHNFQIANAGIGNSKMFKFYMNHSCLSEFYTNFSTEANELVDMLDESLTFSAMELDLKNNKLSFDGYTALDSIYSYIRAFANVGTGKIRGFNIASQQSAAYFSLSFDDFRRFYSSLLDEYRKGNAQEVDDLESLMNIGQKLLGVDISEDFLSWIGNEIVISKLRPLSDKSRDIDMAIMIHANDIEQAQEGLGRVIKHIRRRTPLSFDIEPYRNFEINYLEMKGFFKMFLGNLFKDIEKPFFTYIEDYVVFANSQEVLKQIIDDYLMGRTLSHDTKFVNFTDEFDAKSNISVFVQMPKMYQTLYRYAPEKDKAGIEENKDIIYSFARIGFQLTNDGGMFKTSLQAEYDAEAREEDESQIAENQMLVDPLIMKIDTLGFVVSFPEDFDMSDGPKKIMYPDSTHVYQEGNIIGGKAQGIWRTYYENGLLQSTVNYEKGKITGIGYFYYKKRDKLMAEVNFEDGTFEGEYFLYYENGTRKAKFEYKDGKKHGEAEYYHTNGNLHMRCKYKKGEISGKTLVYDEKGNKIGKQKLKSID